MFMEISMASQFAQFCLENCMPTAMEIGGESITITRPAAMGYDPATGAARTPEDGVTETSVEATAVVSDETVMEGKTLRATGALTVQTAAEVLEGDTVTIRSLKYRVKNVHNPIEGVYQFEARR